MNKKSNSAKPAGFSFGEAMFNIKDLTQGYEQFNQPSQPLQPIPVTKPIVKPMQNKPIQTNIKAPLKPQPKTTVLQQKVPVGLPKQTFKMPAGKQFSSSIKTFALNQVKSVQGVFELTQAKALSQWEYNLFGQGVTSQTLVQKPQVSFSFAAEDIKQGQLGNCYFISALAAIAHCPFVLHTRIPHFRQYGQHQKSYLVKMFQSGKLIQIVVDNLFSCNYCKPVLNDISPMILEKAYAQVYGNYQVLHNGHASDALRDLTGAPAVYLDLKNKAQLIQGIKSAFANRFGVVIASKKQVANQTICCAHSYNVLGYDILGGHLFLRLRDPRGWTKADFDLPVKLREPQENGIFWVGQNDLDNNFQVISVCKVIKGYSYFFKTFSRKQLNNRTGSLLLRSKQSTRAFVSIHQKHKKFFDQQFSYDIIRLLVAQVSVATGNLQVVDTIKVDFNAQQVCCMQIQVQANKQYAVIGQVGKKQQKEQFSDQIFTISAYCQHQQINFEQIVGNIELQPFLINYVLNHPEEFRENQSQQGLRKLQGPLFGHICLYYQNRGQKSLIEQTEYTVKNIEVSEKRVQLGPGQSKLIMHAIGGDNNCSHQCSMKTKTFYK